MHWSELTLSILLQEKPNKVHSNKSGTVVSKEQESGSAVGNKTGSLRNENKSPGSKNPGYYCMTEEFGAIVHEAV